MKCLAAGTRGSDLARAQTEWVCGKLAALYPELHISVSIIKTGGDMHADRPLAAWDGAGAFTRELEEALLEKRIDFAVHSLKDLPTEQPSGLCIAAIPARAPVEDVLFTDGRYTLATLPPGARVGTSSPRRKLQLLVLRPDLKIVEIRGNVPTRIRRVRQGDLDAVVLARAGLARLGLEAEIDACMLDTEEMLPAPGQGALAIEIRAEDRFLAQWLQPLNDPETAEAVGCERTVLKSFGGGCRVPIAVLARPEESGRVLITAFAASEDNSRTSRLSRLALPGTAEETGRALGERLRRQVRQDTGGPFPAATFPKESPLAGRRIVITRAREHSDFLQHLLKNAGAAVRLFPTVEIVPEPPVENTQDAPAYDWILFTSANAVHPLFYSACFRQVVLSGPPIPRIAAIGPATFHALQQWGAQPVLPLTANAEGMFAMIEAAAAPLEGRRFLLPRSQKARPWLCERLRAAGAIVDDPIVYQTLYRSPSAYEKIVLHEFLPHALLFMSPSAVEGFQKACPEPDWSTIYSIVSAVAIGPSTAEAVRAAGFKKVHESPEQSTTGVVRFLEAMWSNPAS